MQPGEHLPETHSSPSSCSSARSNTLQQQRKVAPVSQGGRLARTSALVGFFITLALLSVTPTQLSAQQTSPTSVELATTFSIQRSLEVNTAQNFWAEGGSIELGADAFHGFGLAANITGVHTSSVGNTGIPLSLLTATFGPRYRWHDGHHLSLYGEGLLGEANAFGSLFPAVAGAQSDANALALRIGGGLDLRLSHHLETRVLEAAWLRTQLPNSTGNVQNNLVLGAGLVLRIGH